MRIDPSQIHVFPHGDSFIVYQPAANSMMVVDPAALNLLHQASGDETSYEKLHNFPILRENVEKYQIASNRIAERPVDRPIEPFCPTEVTLFPSHSCQLRCTYCYASAENNMSVMPQAIAEAAINFVCSNAVALGADEFHVSFHGGGEPFFAGGGKLLKHAREYAEDLAQRNGMKVSSHVSTNGVLSHSQLKWIKEHGIDVQLSFDGPEEIQNVNRPLLTHKPSFPHVMRSLRFFEENGIKYSIRATVAAEEATRLKEIVDFFVSISTTRRLFLEPLCECGRCESTGATMPDADLFLSHFIAAKQHASTFGWDVRSSLDDTRHRAIFCGAHVPNFCVTPEGYVTSCYEVMKCSDPKSKIFFYGEYMPSEAGTFRFDAKRIEHLQGRVAEKMADCTECVALRSCAGDCAAKGPADIYRSNPEAIRCQIIRGNVLHKLHAMADDLVKEGCFAVI